MLGVERILLEERLPCRFENPDGNLLEVGQQVGVEHTLLVMSGKYFPSHDGDSYTRLLTSEQSRRSRSESEGGRKRIAGIAVEVA
jgi:hypothetical protein